MAGIYTTYARANDFSERAASLKAAQAYMQRMQEMPTTQLRTADKKLIEPGVCVVESSNLTMREVIGRATTRGRQIRGELRLASMFLWAFCTFCFLLLYYRIEVRLWLQEKRYCVALIKYIHDMDGKKRMACLI